VSKISFTVSSPDSDVDTYVIIRKLLESVINIQYELNFHTGDFVEHKGLPTRGVKCCDVYGHC
jgi:hypothetical protein